MKQFFSILILLVASALFYNNVYATNAIDSSVVISANWKKNDTHIFQYTQSHYEINNNDTIVFSKYSRDFNVQVKDSTTHLFLLEFKRSSLPSEGDSIILDEVPLQLMTNHSGALIKVLNWDAYLAWRNNDIELTSDDLMPYVSMMSFNGKKLKLYHDYKGAQNVSGHEVELNDSVKSITHMRATQDFIDKGESNLITINTTTAYHNLTTLSPIPLFDTFMQVVDSNSGWPLATYSERRRKIASSEIVKAWDIKLLK